MSNDNRGTYSKNEPVLLWECIAQDANGGCCTENTLPNLE